MRAEIIDGREVTLRASVRGDDHPDLLALESRMGAMAGLPSPNDIVTRLLKPNGPCD